MANVFELYQKLFSEDFEDAIMRLQMLRNGTCFFELIDWELSVLICLKWDDGWHSLKNNHPEVIPPVVLPQPLQHKDRKKEDRTRRMKSGD